MRGLGKVSWLLACLVAGFFLLVQGEALLAQEQALAAAQEGTLSAGQFVERYIEARGGRDAWRAIESLKVSGTFTSFSRDEPFTALYLRDGGYRFDTRIQEREAHWGVDEAGPWWMRPMQDMTAARRPGPRDAIRIAREGQLEPVLFDFADKGHRVEMIGPAEVDGMDVLSLRVTLASGLEETWHLDPETFLEVAIDSRVHDYTQTGEEIDQRAYFSDFREVGGVMIPYLEEREYKSRHTVHVVESVEINPPLHADTFSMPVSAAMHPLQALVGQWRVMAEKRPGPQAPWDGVELSSEVTRVAGGGLLEERLEKTGRQGEPVTVVWSLSYDPFAEVYRLTTFDSSSGQLRVFDGARDDAGDFLLSNAETGTRLRSGEREIYERFHLRSITAEGFEMEREVSVDGGESWFSIERYTYRR